MKVKTYVILLRHKKTNKILAYAPCGKYKYNTKYVKVERQSKDWREWSEIKNLEDRPSKWQRNNHLLNALEDIRSRIAKKSPSYDVFISRLGSKNCPIVVDWSDLVDAKVKGQRVYERQWYLRPFKVKES